jgi:hypothetical protein
MYATKEAIDELKERSLRHMPRETAKKLVYYTRVTYSELSAGDCQVKSSKSTSDILKNLKEGLSLFELYFPNINLEAQTEIIKNSAVFSILKF